MNPPADYLNHLFSIVESRKGGDPSTSYIAKRFAQGKLKIAQKVGEEGVELALAAAAEGKQEIINESADLLFHMLILWSATGVTPGDVLNECQRREGVSGLDEKAGRKE